MVVYLDGIIGLNFLIDFLLLLGVNRLSGYPPSYGRTAISAALGGGYTGMCFIPPFSFLAAGIWRAVFLVLVSMAAFGINRSAFHRGILLVLLSMALGGLAISADLGSLTGLLVCAGVLCFLCKVGFHNNALHRIIYSAVINNQDRSVPFYVLQDTGNQLKDPVTGEPVLVVSPRIAKEIFNLDHSDLQSPLKTMTDSAGKGYHLIPFSTVGEKSKFMLALHWNDISINGKKGRRLIALAPETFSSGEYDGLIGGMI